MLFPSADGIRMDALVFLPRRWHSATACDAIGLKDASAAAKAFLQIIFIS
jgi:hypothetical protein